MSETQEIQNRINHPDNEMSLSFIDRHEIGDTDLQFHGPVN